MPDPIESAFQKIVENAKIGCLGCSAERLSDQLFANIGKRPDIGDQTEAHNEGCRATIDLAAEGMLAAALAGWNSNCDSAFAELNAEINRLRAHEALIKEIDRGDWPPKEEDA